MRITRYNKFLNEYNIFEEGDEFFKDIYLNPDFVVKNIPNGLSYEYKWCGGIQLKYDINDINGNYMVNYNKKDLQEKIIKYKLNSYYRDAFKQDCSINENTIVINLFEERLNDKSKVKIVKKDDNGRYIISHPNFRYTCYGVLLKMNLKEKWITDKIEYVFILSLYKKDIKEIYSVKDISASDWEMILVCSWYFNKKQYEEHIDNYYEYVNDVSNVPIEKVRKYDFRNGEIDSLKYEPIIRRSDIMIKKLREIINIDENNKDYNMKYIGNLNYNVKDRWLKNDNKNKNQPPKTDIIIYNVNEPENPLYKISLKKKGGSQIFSGGYNETDSIFYNVINSKSYNKILINTVENFLRDFIEIKDYIQIDTTINDILKDKKNFNHEIITMIDSRNKELTKNINDIFKHDGFKKDIVKESLTGLLKFGQDSVASADHILIFDDMTTDINFVNLDDQDFLKKICDHVTFNVSFKSSNLKTRPVTRFIENIKDIFLMDKEDVMVVEDLQSWIEKNKKKYNRLLKILNDTRLYFVNLLSIGVKRFLRVWGISYDIKIENDYDFKDFH
jgi:hypothetical protein